ncbi:MAG: AMP-binding protein [Cytophagaceae bacterium]|nr:AMP-binding protein [Cytophagaceae bacterium]MDW8456410.1 AMP-binding protein [Cytophagaceae bacterium]
MSYLWVEENRFEYSYIKQNKISEENLSSYSKACYDFCHLWLNGLDTLITKTSGSTGEPKEIRLNRTQLICSAHKTIKYFGLTSSDVLLCVLNTAYIAGRMMLIRAMECGAAAICVPPASDIYTYLKQRVFNFTAVVPLQLPAILRYEQEGDSMTVKSIKGILVGGAPLSNALRELCKKSSLPIYESYGMTETCSHIALKKISKHDISNAFTIMDNIQVSRDERSCLVIRGDVTNDEIIVTNDIVELINDKQFRWLGRYDNTINSGGIKVQPEKVEKVIEEIFLSAKISHRFFVCGTADERLGTAVTLCIEGTKGDIDEEYLLQKCKEFLTPYEVPKKIKYVNEMATTATGKIDRIKTIQGM